MKKQISLLLVAVALNLSSGAQAGASRFYSTARQFAPSVSRYTFRPSGLPQGVRNYTTGTPISFPRSNMPMPTRTFTQSTGNLAPELMTRPSYWEQFKNSPTAQWITAGLLAGSAFIGGSALAQEKNQPEQIGWFERWFGKPSGYSHGKTQKMLSEKLKEKRSKKLKNDRIWQELASLVTDKYDVTEEEIIGKIQSMIDQGVDFAHAKKEIAGIVGITNGHRLFNDINIVKFLLEHGLNINEKDHRGRPLFYHALLGAEPRTLELLFEHGADANIKDDKGVPILFDAIKLANRNHYKDNFWTKDTARNNLIVLLKHGAYIDTTDQEGKTALEFAEKNYPDIVPILEKYGKMGYPELSPVARYIYNWYKAKE